MPPNGYRLTRFDRCDSTNEEARRQGDAGAAAGLWIVSDEQTKGRGRRGRGWQSPPGNLYSSLLLRPDRPTAEAAQLSFVAALAVRDLATHYLRSDSQVLCKWPNDVLLEGRKYSGILLESVAGPGGKPAWVVLGIGINVVFKPAELADAVATLADYCNPPPEVGEVFTVLSQRFEMWLQRWLEEGFAPVREAWLSSAHRLGEAIEARLPSETLTGRFAGLDESGSLLLETKAGVRHVIQAADVFPAFGEAD